MTVCLLIRLSQGSGVPPFISETLREGARLSPQGLSIAHKKRWAGAAMAPKCTTASRCIHVMRAKLAGLSRPHRQARMEQTILAKQLRHTTCIFKLHIQRTPIRCANRIPHSDHSTASWQIGARCRHGSHQTSFPLNEVNDVINIAAITNEPNEFTRER